MPLNSFISELSEKGRRVQDLLDDRLPKAEGLAWKDASQITVVPSSGTTWVMERGAAGDYRIKRTSVGAETHQLAVGMDAIARTTASKGFKVLDVVWVYSVATVDATSVDVTMQLATFANAAAPVIASYGGTLTYDANHNTAAKRKSSTGGVNPHLMTVTAPSPVFQNDDKVWLSSEMAIVIPNTCIFRVYGAALHVTHDYL